MIWKNKGAVGIVSAGGVGDTDEIIKQKRPVYMDYLKKGRGIRPGRNEQEFFNAPVVISGMYIRTGDVIVADGDGVIVVLREKALEVVDTACEEKNIDMEARKKTVSGVGHPARLYGRTTISLLITLKPNYYIPYHDKKTNYRDRMPNINFCFTHTSAGRYTFALA